MAAMGKIVGPPPVVRGCNPEGLRDFHWHDIRNTFASRLVMADVDIRRATELMGNKRMKYAHLAPQHKLVAVERLARYNLKQ